MTTEIRRDANGQMHLYTHDVPVAGAIVTGLKALGNGEQAFEVYISTKHVSLGEVSKVVPFVRAA